MAGSTVELPVFVDKGGRNSGWYKIPGFMRMVPGFPENFGQFLHRPTVTFKGNNILG